MGVVGDSRLLIFFSAVVYFLLSMPMCAWRVVAEADRNVEEPSHKLHQGIERFSMYGTWSASLDCCMMCTMDLEPVSE